MLLNLSIKNVALIDEIDIEFNSGLNVLSGETGAGKSVILDSINFVLGAKADKTMIRNGESFCLVTCLFDQISSKTQEILKEFDIEAGSELLIKRKFDVNGNGYIKVNGENVTATMLRKITSLLVDVHGQSEHFSLLSKNKQLECVDAGAKISDELSELAILISNLRANQKKLASIGGDPNERFKRIDLLEYQINEIEKAELKEGEKEELLLQKNKLNNLEKLSSALQVVSSIISDDGGVTDGLISIEQNLKSISDLGNEFSILQDRVQSVREELADISDTVIGILDGFDTNDLNLDEIENRIEIYRNFSRKYGNTLEDIHKYLENAISERDLLINFEKNCESIIKTIKKQRAEIYDLCVKISNKRKKFAVEFSEKITAKLAELGMPKAKFLVAFDKIPEIDEVENFSLSGLDKIEFLFSANAGEPVKPLSKIISGGEMSRFMLALKTQLSVDSSTYIFDEIDAGISGVTASIVAKHFAQIANGKQIIAISHLPQIVSMADNSLFIKKREEDDRAYTEVLKLSKEQKISEIIRLIGGDVNDETAIAHARKMISDADNYKSTIN